MTIRTRLTLWYAGVMFVSLLSMGVLTYRTFAPEPHGTILPPKQHGRSRRTKSDFREVAADHLLVRRARGVAGAGRRLVADAPGASRPSPRSPAPPNASTNTI